MKIAAAQIKPIKGDVSENIELHKIFIKLAIDQQTDLIFFPELSVTGYEPELAEDLAITQDDPRFDCFQGLSDDNLITIGLGMPTRSKSDIHISMTIFQPGRARQTYSKQHLHSDEEPYFSAGNQRIILTVENKKIAPAICYESLLTQHAENADRLGAEIYIASVAKPQNGVDKANYHYPAIARQFSMPVLMSNSVGHCDNFISAGQTAVWSASGDLIKRMDNKSQGILIFDTATQKAFEYIIPDSGNPL